MATVQHYISVVEPSDSSFTRPNNVAGGVDYVVNLHTGTSTTAADLLEVRWTQTTSGAGTISPTVSKKDFLLGLETIRKFVIAGGYPGFATPNPDANIPN